MTIIAHFNAFGVPTLLSDLLVSSTANPCLKVDLPASQNINERIFLPSDYYIAGLAQKIVHLSSSLAIAWSGRFERVANLFQSLEPLRTIQDIDADYVRSIIDALDEPIKRDLSLIALVARGEGQLVVHRVAHLGTMGLLLR
jgi:hypothetical protein